MQKYIISETQDRFGGKKYTEDSNAKFAALKLKGKNIMKKHPNHGVFIKNLKQHYSAKISTIVKFRIDLQLKLCRFDSAALITWDVCWVACQVFLNG